MASRETLRDYLEDFSARALAADPADSEAVQALRADLDAKCKSARLPKAARNLLKLASAALQTAETPQNPDASQLLDAVAAAAACAVEQLRKPDETAETRAAATADLINNLLANPTPQPVPPAQPHPATNETTKAPTTAENASATPAATSAAQAPAASQSSALLEADAELVADFIAESCERIASAEAALLALEANPDDAEQINTVLRAFHTVKGASGFLGLDAIGKLAHLSENLLIRARDGQVRMVDEHADTALQSCDVLRTMIQALSPAGDGPTTDPARLAELTARLSADDNHDAGKTATTSAPGKQTHPAQTLPAPTSTTGQPPADADADTGAAADPEPGADAAPKTAASADAFTGLAKAAAHLTGDGVRVSAERLDELVNLVGELVIAHSIIAQSPQVAGGTNAQLTRGVSHAGKILRSMQDLSLGLRMVPLRATFAKMARLVRDLARKSGKDIQFVTAGEDTEIDRNMVEALSDPLVHMIRNAVDHGVEPADGRQRTGKSPTATIELRAFHAAGNVVIELSDDGRGLDRDRIVARARRDGLVGENDEPTDEQVSSLVFRPGLSTAEQVTDVSGRGVGMDVVKRNVDSLRGKIEVRSRAGAGATFTIRLPLTLAIADAMLLSVGNERYLLPTVSIEHSFRPAAGDVHTVAGRGEMVRVRGETLPVFRLGRLFDIKAAIDDPTRALLIVIDGGAGRVAIMADDLLGQQQVVIKSLGDVLAKVPGVSGGAILGDGRVGLILDPSGLVQIARGRTRAA